MIDTEYQRLPYNPESIESIIKARFPEAIARNFTLVDMALSIAGQGEIAANLNRRHVFDLNDGVRMMATREDLRPIGRFIHLSFGVNEMMRHLWDYGREPGWIKLEARARELAAQFMPDHEPDHAYCSPKAFHMFFEQKDKI